MPDYKQQYRGVRRYAYSLSGRSEVADSLTLAAIERCEGAAIALGELFNRKVLYRSVTEIWNGEEGADLSTLHGRGQHLDFDDSEFLAAMPPLAGQAFALIAMEKFSLADAAEICNVPAREIRDALVEAMRTLAPQNSGHVLIIEDEFLIARLLERTVRQLGCMSTSIAATENDAIAAARRDEPRIVLSDIKLADGGSGLTAVREIVKDKATPVVYVTAYPSELVAGGAAEHSFVVPKPIDTDKIIATCSQAMFLSQLSMS